MSFDPHKMGTRLGFGLFLLITVYGAYSGYRLITSLPDGLQIQEPPDFFLVGTMGLPLAAIILPIRTVPLIAILAVVLLFTALKIPSIRRDHQTR